MRNIKNFIGLFLASIILTSCGLKTYEEMHSPYPRLIVREGPKAEQAIEDLKAKGYTIKKIRPSATIEGAIVVFYEIPGDQSQPQITIKR